MSAQAIASFSF